MKFEIIVRNKQKDFEIISFNLNGASESRWQKWREYLIVGALSSAVTTLALFYWFPERLKNLEVELQNSRSTTVLIRNKDEQENQRNSPGADGTATTGH